MFTSYNFESSVSLTTFTNLYVRYYVVMTNRYIPVSTLTHETKDWMIKVIVTEKSPIYPGKDQTSWFIRLMFSDEQVRNIVFPISLIVIRKNLFLKKYHFTMKLLTLPS